MIVTCPSCSARYKFDEAKLKGRAAKITCPKCAHKFLVRPPAEAAPPIEEEEPETFVQKAVGMIRERPILGAVGGTDAGHRGRNDGHRTLPRRRHRRVLIPPDTSGLASCGAKLPKTEPATPQARPTNPPPSPASITAGSP